MKDLLGPIRGAAVRDADADAHADVALVGQGGQAAGSDELG
ncbi:hypothetical protein [Streptomyces sp. LN785]